MLRTRVVTGAARRAAGVARAGGAALAARGAAAALPVPAAGAPATFARAFSLKQGPQGVFDGQVRGRGASCARASRARVMVDRTHAPRAAAARTRAGSAQRAVGSLRVHRW